MLYFLLFLHYGFYVFFMMCFAAYIYAVTHNNWLKYISTSILWIYAILEFAIISYLLVYLDKAVVVWGFLGLSCVISIIIVLLLRIKKCADISIWIPFSIVFSPLIIVPVLTFVLFSKIKLKMD